MPEIFDKVRTSDADRLRAWLSLGGLVVAFAIYDAFVIVCYDMWLPTPPEWIAWLLLGGCLVQPLLLGLWASLGPGSAVIRVPLVGASLAFAVLLCGYAQRWFGRDQTMPGRLMIGMAAIAIVIFLISALVGAIARWCFEKPLRISFAGRSGPEASQFGTKHLLVVTTACAVVLAMGGGFASDWRDLTPDATSPSFLFVFGVFGVVAFAACLPTAIIPYAIISQMPTGGQLLWGGIFWPVWSFGLVVAIVVFTDEAVPFRYLIGVQPGAAAMGAASAIALRWAGYRLMSRNKPSASTDPQSQV